jgi:hypothetical protein
MLGIISGVPRVREDRLEAASGVGPQLDGSQMTDGHSGVRLRLPAVLHFDLAGTSETAT